MAKLNTVPTDKIVEKFLNSIKDQQKKQNCFIWLNLMK
jgi:hypothetical protein